MHHTRGSVRGPNWALLCAVHEEEGKMLQQCAWAGDCETRRARGARRFQTQKGSCRVRGWGRRRRGARPPAPAPWHPHSTPNRRGTGSRSIARSGSDCRRSYPEQQQWPTWPGRAGLRRRTGTLLGHAGGARKSGAGEWTRTSPSRPVPPRRTCKVVYTDGEGSG